MALVSVLGCAPEKPQKNISLADYEAAIILEQPFQRLEKDMGELEEKMTSKDLPFYFEKAQISYQIFQNSYATVIEQITPKMRNRLNKFDANYRAALESYKKLLKE